MANSTVANQRSKTVPAWKVGLRGALLGLLIPLGVIACWLAVDTLVLFPLANQRTPFLLDSTWSSQDALVFVVVFCVNVLALWLFYTFPGLISGALIALALWLIQGPGQLTTRRALALGAIVGAGAGALTSLIINILWDPGAQWSPQVNPMFVGAIGGFAGLLHGYLVDRWLRTHMT